jgi:CheY-like chemotaxis protein
VEPGKRRIVLLIDDEAPILRSTQLILELVGCTAHTAANAEAAFESAGRARPDVILQDVRMPGLDLGAHLRRLAREPSTAGVPVVLFSASMEIDELAARYPEHEVLEKPFSVPDLVAALERAAKRSPSQDLVATPNA